MRTPRTLMAATATGILGLMLGIGIAPEQSVGTASVQPTPRIIIETPAPVAQPTPRIVERSVTPESCRTAIDGMLDQSIADSQLILDLMSAYSDFPEENITQFGRRAEEILSNAPVPDPADYEPIYAAASDCLAS